jgi:hypothetical protein
MPPEVAMIGAALLLVVLALGVAVEKWFNKNSRG